MRRIINGILIIILCLSVYQAVADEAGSETVMVQVNLTYRYDLTESMLPLINGFRTDSNAWVWSEDNAEKTLITGLKPLTYDYGLETVAMRRAAELAVHYSNTRPDGTSCFTLYPSKPGGIRGENYLGGPTTARKAFEEWKGEEKNYAGQGQRRNLLDQRFTHVGVGCVQVNTTVRQANGSTRTVGHLFWVQAFSSYGVSQKRERLESGYQLISTSVDLLKKDGLTNISTEPDRLKLKAGESVRVPYLKAQTGSLGNSILYILNPTWEASDKTVVRIEGSMANGIRGGKTVLTISGLSSEPVQVEVEVSGSATCVTHDWDEGQVLDQPTCSQKGSMLYTCVNCGSTKTEEIDLLPHTPVRDPFVAATCTEAGLTIGSHCEVCGAVILAQEEIEALGHDLIAHEGKEPTAIEPGWNEYETCSRCDYSTYVELPPYGFETPTDGYGMKMDDDGNFYVGDFVDSQYSGQGRMVFASGNIYAGEWAEGRIDGVGTFTFTSGDVYKGAFLNGLRHGQGTYTWANGEVYKGEWVRDRRQGYGTFTWPDDSGSYEGYWKNSSYHGEGKLVYANGNVYKGNWEEGVRQGQGRMTYTDGSVYDGEWNQDERHGHGTMIYASGNVYEGQWENGRKQGEGTYTFSNGTIYQGQLADDRISGQGKAVYTSGNTYEGEWENGKKQGTGIYTYANGNVYEGEFDHDRYHGQGKMTYADGSVYEGAWKDGMKHGQGKMVYADGTVQDGTWESNGFVREETTGERTESSTDLPAGPSTDRP